MGIDILLATATSKVAIDAIYYLTRLIKHRSLASGLLAEGLTSEPSPEATQLAQQLAKLTEAETGKPLETLDAQTVQALVSQLEARLVEKYTEGRPIDKSRGVELLEQLRQAE